MNLKTLPIFLTLLFMGVADAMGPLSSAVSANPAMAALMPFFVFIAFAIFSVPGGLLAARIGKKRVLLLGVGTTLLQVAGNPIMRDMSGVGEYGRNLALAQGIKGGGASALAFAIPGACFAYLLFLSLRRQAKITGTP